MNITFEPPITRKGGYMALTQQECIEIENTADKLRIEHELDAQFPVPVDQLAKKLGYRAGAFSPTQNTQMVAGAVDHVKKRIYVNVDESNGRRRFTIAHEIAHVLYDADAETKRIDYRGNDWPTDPKEQRADYFAASLLMPRDVFKLKYQELDQDVAAVASFFGVSYTAARIRRDTLLDDR